VCSGREPAMTAVARCEDAFDQADGSLRPGDPGVPVRARTPPAPPSTMRFNPIRGLHSIAIEAAARVPTLRAGAFHLVRSPSASAFTWHAVQVKSDLNLYLFRSSDRTITHLQGRRA
jgi:hypothetical protein